MLWLGGTGVSILRPCSNQSSSSKLGIIDLTCNNHVRSPPAVFTKLRLCVLLHQKETPAKCDCIQPLLN
jgi:hypothetical protein